MWDRRIIKSNARIALNGRYWTAFGVCILAAFITSAFSLITTPLTMSYESMLQDFEGGIWTPLSRRAGWSTCFRSRIF